VLRFTTFSTRDRDALLSVEQNVGRPVAILGAGLAGLSAGSYLQKLGLPVVVFESSEQIAGLAMSFQDDGFTYDFGAHFVTNRLAKAVGIQDQCRDVKCYGETVLVGGKYYSYPFGLLRNFRFLKSAIREKLKGNNGKSANVSERFREMYGASLASEVAVPLVEEWSGVSAALLAPSVADKIPLSIAEVLFLRTMSLVTRRAIAIGYGKQPPSTRVWHVYPNGGVASLCERLAQPIWHCIRLKSRVEAIVVRDRKVEKIRVNGQDLDVSAVISTIPCNVLPRLIEGTDCLNYLSRFRYRPMVFVLLQMHGRNLLKDTVVWTPESSYPFLRLTETPISMPWLAPPGKTLITVDIGSEIGGEYWSMPDDELGYVCLRHLTDIIPHAKARFLKCRVLRTPFAYPVFLNEYETDRQRLGESTGVEFLYSVGRNGEFDHLLTEDVYWRTMAKMQSIAPEVTRRIRQAETIKTVEELKRGKVGE
jgi:protoporphyrinogen/coproporphyrinogen III oxidase